MTPTLLCKLMGLAFIAAAVWGFVDGHEVLIFHVNTAHNLVHLVSGVVALICGFTGSGPARAFCVLFGLAYGVVALAGFAGVTQVVDLLHLNDADNWLHAGLSLVFLIVGLGTLIPSGSASMT